MATSTNEPENKMATLTYWIAERLDDSACYNLRAKTKKEVLAIKAAHECTSSYGEPKKVTVNYDDSFDLVVQCLDENRGHWE